MSTLAERSASETYKQFYGAVPIDQVITAKSIRVSAQSLQTEQSILFERVDSFQNARTELTAASLLQKKFGIPLCLAAVQPFLILLSKERKAIDWETMAAMQLMDQLQSMLQIALIRLAVITAARLKQDRQLASLEKAKNDLQEDAVHESVLLLKTKTEQQVDNRTEFALSAIADLQQESATLEMVVMELSAMQENIAYQLRSISNWQTPSIQALQTQ